jgi:hypothetical protein
MTTKTAYAKQVKKHFASKRQKKYDIRTRSKLSKREKQDDYDMTYWNYIEDRLYGKA